MEFRIIVSSKQGLICLPKELLLSFTVSQRLPQSCITVFLFIYLFFVAAVHLSLLPALSGVQPQSNTTVSGSVGMQSADEPKVAHLFSVLPRPNTQKCY